MIEMGLCRRYINDHCDRIKRVFKWGVSEELIGGATYLKLKTVSGLPEGRTAAIEHAPVAPVADADIAATLPKLPSVVQAMVQFQRLTGCRPGEVCLLRPMDIDRTGAVWCYKPSSHKTEHHGRQRRIFVGPKAQAVLLPYLLRASDAYCFCPRESAKVEVANRPGPKTQRQRARQPRPTRRGLRYTVASYRRAITRACEIAEVMHWHPNQLRHSLATDVRKAFGVEGAATVLGHAKTSTAEIYAERDFEVARRIMEKVG
jgi:integrase